MNLLTRHDAARSVAAALAVGFLCAGCGSLSWLADDDAAAKKTSVESEETAASTRPESGAPPASIPTQSPRKPAKRRRRHADVKYAIPNTVSEKRRHPLSVDQRQRTTPESDDRPEPIVPPSAAAGAVGTKPPLMAESSLIPPTYQTNPFLSKDSFIVTWNVLGPFKYELDDLKGGDPREALAFRFMRGESRLNGLQPAPEGTSWRLIHVVPDKDQRPGGINLNSLYGDVQRGVAYAVAVLRAPERMRNLSLCVGSGDFIKIWVNGELIHAYYKKPRTADWDQDIVEDVSLREGHNFVVVKCVNVEGPWMFFFRLTNADGMPVCVAK